MSLQAELRASIFQAVEQQDRAGDPGGEKAVLGTCSSLAKALHDTRNGNNNGTGVTHLEPSTKTCDGSDKLGSSY